jgi:hypothetical protein
MANEYKVTASQPWTYLDEMGRVVNGFRVYFEIISLRENFTVDVPTLDPVTVKAKVEALVKQRLDLAKL